MEALDWNAFLARFVSVNITWNALGDGWGDDYLLEPLYCIVTLVFITIWFDRSLLFAFVCHW
jgi:hypothetical protein